MRCYYPLVVVVGEIGDLLDVRLWEGNVYTADGALGFILPLLDRMEKNYCQVASVRMDAGFLEDELLSALEGRGVGYVARLRANSRLAELAAPFLGAWEPVGGESRIRCHELTY